MSIIFGLLKPRGLRPNEEELQQLGEKTVEYGNEGTSTVRQGRLGMGFQAVGTHERSALNLGPARDGFGNVVCFDGRLDNYRDLISELGLADKNSPDPEIVLAAFRRWGKGCFAKLSGDWALSLWSMNDDLLLLARDHAGARTLYFSCDREGTIWSTYLDSFAGLSFSETLSRTYAARFLAGVPLQCDTPYEQIEGVRPGHYAVVKDGKVCQTPHWDPQIRGTVRHTSVEGYDEEFLSLFGQSVARRTVPGAPILAQLSGGMDSTAIVCMSDHLRRSADPGADLLDTLSFFDDSEVSLNERPYFSITESRRGKTGIHVNAAFSQRTFEPVYGEGRPYLIPGADTFSQLQERRLYELVWERGYRSVLSGIGGDEVLGGVPDPFPELAGHLVSGKIRSFIGESLNWCLIDRTPLVSSICQTIRFSYRLYAKGQVQNLKLPPWLKPDLRERAANQGSPIATRVGAAPYQLNNALAWWAIMETLPHLRPQLLFRPEYRYPMLDRELVTYLFSIPCELLVRPGRRRALMRRALRGIVPEEILERKRKAFQLRAPMHAIQRAQPKLEQLFSESELAARGWIDVERFRGELKTIGNGQPEWTQAALKTIAFELWLKARRGNDSPRKQTALRDNDFARLIAQ